MAEGTLLLTGLPDLPDEGIDPKLYDDFLTLHRGIKNLAFNTSRYTGVDAPEQAIWSSLQYADTLLTANHTRMYPVAANPITAGMVVNLFNSAGQLRARAADATVAGRLAYGVAMTSAAAGEQFEMYWLRGLVNTIGGMVIGTLYWLSTTGGSIQNVAPAVAGNVQQPIGVALQSSLLLMDISLMHRIV